MDKTDKRSINKQEKLIKLYKASLKVFAKYGFKKATVETIAMELGMTKGNIYLYVKNKKDLYEKTIVHAVTEFQEDMRQSVSHEEDAVKQIIMLAETGVRYFTENSDFHNVIIDAPNIITEPAAFGTVFFEIRQSGINIVKAILERGVEKKQFRDFEVDYVAELLYHFYILFIVNTFVLVDIVSDGKSASKMYKEIVNLVLHGIVKVDSSSISEYAGLSDQSMARN